MECPAAVDTIVEYLCPRFWMGEEEIDDIGRRMVAHNRHVHQCLVMGELSLVHRSSCVKCWQGHTERTSGSLDLAGLRPNETRKTSALPVFARFAQCLKKQPNTHAHA